MTEVEGEVPASLPLDPELTPPLKRKHDEISNDNIVNGEHTANDRQDPVNVQAAIQHVWQILNTRDYPSFILSHVSSYRPSSSSADDPEDTEEKHTDKKQKLSPSPKSPTIASQVEKGSYTSVDTFASDIDTACADLSKQIQSKSQPVNGFHYWSLPPEILEQQHLLANLSSFTKLLHSLVFRQQQPVQEESTTSLPNSPDPEHHSEDKMNGVQEDKDKDKDTEKTNNAPITQEEVGRAVLTLFGNAQGHRQLFSSLQRPYSSSKRSGDSFFASTAGSVVPLRENGLPLGISSTMVVPSPRDDSSVPTQPRRLGDVFATPSSVPAMAPPKTPKLASSNNDSTITWSHENAHMPTRQFGYTGEKLATGAWLGYNGIAPAEEPATPQAKRKQRDRALSVGESSLTSSQVTKAAQLQAEEEALFRSAYSSFAPSIDNSVALITEDSRNMLWWHKYGDRSGDEMYDYDSDLDLEENDGDAVNQEQIDEDQLFKGAVEDFIAPTLDEEDVQNPETGDTDAMLEEVWQLLEILSSYQRIRMSSLSSSGRSTLVQNSPLQDLTSEPATPSAAEVEAHEKLKARLASVISDLPPYVVAKLQSDQLGDLYVSRDIPIEVEDYRGVMEEDKASRDAKQAAYYAAAGVPPANNRHMPIQPANQPPRPHHQMSARPPSHQHYNPNTPQPISRGQPQFARQPLSSWQKPNGHYQMSTQRPSYANPQHFNQQTPRNAPAPLRPSYNQITPGRAPHTPQLPNGGYQAPGMMSNYQQPQRPQNFGSPNMNNMPNGNYVPQAASPSKMMQQQQHPPPPPRNYSPQSQYHHQGQPMSMQQHPQSHQQASPIQYNQAQSPQQFQNRQQLQQPHHQQQQQNPPLQSAQVASQPPPQPHKALSNSPHPRPSSSGGTGTLATTNANTETAVESRSDTPATTVATSTPVPAQPAAHPPPPAEEAEALSKMEPSQPQDVSTPQPAEEQQSDAEVEAEAEEQKPSIPNAETIET